jgi:hypothetical protein
VVTFGVLIVLVATKFREGAWVVVLAIPLLILLFQSIKRHYGNVAEKLQTSHLTSSDLRDIGDVVILPIAGLHRGTLRAIKYAKRISNNVRAITILTDPTERNQIQSRWDRFPDITQGVELIFLEYEYRDILVPLLDYITHVNQVEYPEQLITVVIPEFIPESLGANLLHNQTAHLLRWHLRSQIDVVVIDVPFHL